MTEEIKKKLRDELNTLEHELAFDIPRELKKAVALGDLSENAEYHTAKQRQEYLKARVRQLGQRLADLSLVNMNNIPKDKVGLGSMVTIFDSTKNEEMQYELVASEQSDVAAGRISTTSPIGRALLNKKVGDIATVVTPGGSREMEILKLSTMHDLALAKPEAERRSENDRNEREHMSWTSGVGRACGVLLDAIVRLLALSRINPNVLTVMGLVGQHLRRILVRIRQRRQPAPHVFLRRPGHNRIGILRSGGWPRCPRFESSHPLRRLFRFHRRPLQRCVALSGIAGFLRPRQPLLLVVLAALAMISAIMVSYARARAESLIGTCSVGFMERPERLVLLIIGALFNEMAPVLWVIAVLSTITVIHRVLYTWQRTREMDAPAKAQPDSSDAHRKSRNPLLRSLLNYPPQLPARTKCQPIPF